ncbi:MAG: hypothetical protein QG671_2191 [Actinomycetota bacterium]|nr:hypothetical protein [Actinomycetota bacterium]
MSVRFPVPGFHTPRSTAPRVVRAGVAAAAAIAISFGTAAPADAHLPVVLTEANTAAAIASSPYVPDGTASVAFYGWLDAPRDTRAVRIRLDAGQEFLAQVLIPDLAPEKTLVQHKLPRLYIKEPNGKIRPLPSKDRVPFAEPYTKTNYIIISELIRPADTGTYTLIVTGRAASRFILATGGMEGITTSIENASIGTVADVQRWYTNPLAPLPGTLSRLGS